MFVSPDGSEVEEEVRMFSDLWMRGTGVNITESYTHTRKAAAQRSQLRCCISYLLTSWLDGWRKRSDGGCGGILEHNTH